MITQLVSKYYQKIPKKSENKGIKIPKKAKIKAIKYPKKVRYESKNIGRDLPEQRQVAAPKKSQKKRKLKIKIPGINKVSK